MALNVGNINEQLADMLAPRKSEIVNLRLLFMLYMIDLFGFI